MQWLQEPNQSNADNLNNVRGEASRYFKNKLKLKLMNVKTHVKWRISETSEWTPMTLRRVTSLKMIL
jgi:hypothetical protein